MRQMQNYTYKFNLHRNKTNTYVKKKSQRLNHLIRVQSNKTRYIFRYYVCHKENHKEDVAKYDIKKSL